MRVRKEVTKILLENGADSSLYEINKKSNESQNQIFHAILGYIKYEDTIKELVGIEKLFTEVFGIAPKDDVSMLATIRGMLKYSPDNTKKNG